MENSWKLKSTFYWIMLYLKASTLRNVYQALIESLFTDPSIKYHIYLIINTHFKLIITSAFFRWSWASSHLFFPTFRKSDSVLVGRRFPIPWSWFSPISPRLRIQTSQVNQPSSVSLVFALWFDSSFHYHVSWPEEDKRETANGSEQTHLHLH